MTVIDGVTNALSTINVGTNPYALAVNSVTNKIYVSNSEVRIVSVIDGSPTKSPPLQPSPVFRWNRTPVIGLAVDSNANKIYVVNYGSSNITVIDGISNTTTTLTDPNVKLTRSRRQLP